MTGKVAAYPSIVHADATSLIVYQGAPNRAISWTLTGSGTLEPLSHYTDAAGRAGARYTPGDAGDIVTVEAAAGA